MKLVVGWIPVMQVFLEPDRLVLRRLTMGDVDNLLGLDADPDVVRFVTAGKRRPRSLRVVAVIKLNGLEQMLRL